MMNNLKIKTLLVAVCALSACGGDSGATDQKVSDDVVIGSFQVTVEGLVSFDEAAKRVKAHNYQNELWEFKGNGNQLRISGRFADEKINTEQPSTKLIHNNVYLAFMYEYEKQRVPVSCKAAKEPKGQIKRVINDDMSSSGSFTIELETCRNTYTSEAIEGIQTPIMVKGRFDRLPVSDSLF